MEILIGREKQCDYVILDPRNRVSRRHAVLSRSGEHLYIQDMSTNGTYVNGKKILKFQKVRIKITDRVTLSTDYVLNLQEALRPHVVSNSQSSDERTVIFQNEKVTYNSGNKSVSFDPEKTSLSDLLDLDDTPFLSVGRAPSCDFSLNNDSVSRTHCEIRMITPLMIEILDVGSTNGTFADGKKLQPKTSYKFSSNVKILLGKGCALDLRKIFPELKIVKRAENAQQMGKAPQPGTPITSEEMNRFRELEDVWVEYQKRQQSAGQVAFKYGIGGAIAGVAAFALAPAALVAGLGALGTMAFTTGGSILGKYLGQMKSNEIRNDLTYEDLFLETYACPRCRESFQKRPWITIRECVKCKIKFK
jgi:pSer/pThr/pTyr-binding forkhead associated (FHA) protein/ribosomal protein L37AE/L43A